VYVTVFAGATAATILGAPIGTAVGKALGWRATFGTLVVFGTIALVGLVFLLPRGIGRAKVREVTPGVTTTTTTTDTSTAGTKPNLTHTPRCTWAAEGADPHR
jgi:predicted MFS family arabinose efflux permease